MRSPVVAPPEPKKAKQPQLPAAAGPPPAAGAGVASSSACTAFTTVDAAQPAAAGTELLSSRLPLQPPSDVAASGEPSVASSAAAASAVPPPLPNAPATRANETAERGRTAPPGTSKAKVGAGPSVVSAAGEAEAAGVAGEGAEGGEDVSKVALPKLDDLLKAALPEGPPGSLQQQADSILMLLRAEWKSKTAADDVQRAVHSTLHFFDLLARKAAALSSLQGTLFQALTAHLALEQQRLRAEEVRDQSPRQQNRASALQWGLRDQSPRQQRLRQQPALTESVDIVAACVLPPRVLPSPVLPSPVLPPPVLPPPVLLPPVLPPPAFPVFVPPVLLRPRRPSRFCPPHRSASGD